MRTALPFPQAPPRWAVSRKCSGAIRATHTCIHVHEDIAATYVSICINMHPCAFEGIHMHAYALVCLRYASVNNIPHTFSKNEAK